MWYLLRVGSSGICHCVTHFLYYQAGSFPERPDAFALVILLFGCFVNVRSLQSLKIAQVLLSCDVNFYFLSAIPSLTLGNSFNPISPDFLFCIVRGTDEMVQCPV